MKLDGQEERRRGLPRCALHYQCLRPSRLLGSPRTFISAPPEQATLTSSGGQYAGTAELSGWAKGGRVANRETEGGSWAAGSALLLDLDVAVWCI